MNRFFPPYFAQDFNEVLTGFSVGPGRVVVREALKRCNDPRLCRVYDAGCGMGNSTALAYASGFTNIEGFDALPEQLQIGQLLRRDRRDELVQRMKENAVVSNYPEAMRQLFLDQLHGDSVDYLNVLTDPQSCLKLSAADVFDAESTARLTDCPADLLIGNLLLDQLIHSVELSDALECLAPLVKRGGYVILSLAQNAFALTDLARDAELWEGNIYRQPLALRAQLNLFRYLSGPYQPIPPFGSRTVRYNEAQVRAGSPSLIFEEFVGPIIQRSRVPVRDSFRVMLRNASNYQRPGDFDRIAELVEVALDAAEAESSAEEVAVLPQVAFFCCVYRRT